MTNRSNPSEMDLAWLGDRNQRPVPDSLTDSLDLLYAAGPDETGVAAAQKKLDQALEGVLTEAVYYDRVPESTIGPFFVAVSGRGVVALSFEESEERFRLWLQRKTKAEVVRDQGKLSGVVSQVLGYLEGRSTVFNLTYDLRSLTPFQKMVLTTVQNVPRGEFLTYGELARRIGKPGAARAVGQALGNNPIPVLIPCHRVLAADGSLGGYSGRGGVKTKESLLRLEGALS